MRRAAADVHGPNTPSHPIPTVSHLPLHGAMYDSDHNVIHVHSRVYTAPDIALNEKERRQDVINVLITYLLTCLQIQRKRAAMTAGRRRLLGEESSMTGVRGHQRASGGSAMATGVQSGHEQNITLIMIVVIIVFMLCNAPARLVQVPTHSR